MTGKPQFTPRQILDAGLRAESVNQLDHAAQFFRFLLEHHAGSPEAGAARDHLRRVSAPRAAEMRPEVRTEPRVEPRPEPRPVAAPAMTGGMAVGAQAAVALDPGIRPPAPPPYANGHAAMPASWADAGPSPFASPRLDEYAAPFQPSGLGSGYGGSASSEPRSIGEFNRPQQVDARIGASPPPVAMPSDIRLTWPHVHLPTPVARYRVGRAMAVTIIGLGYVAIAGGLVMIGISISQGLDSLPRQFGVSVVAVLYGLLLMPGSMVLIGLAMVFAGQAARAVFDSANASRDLVAILRAMADPHEDERGRR